jgi:tRNA threonylcarbamoyl adenosine modification protein YjeE
MATQHFDQHIPLANAEATTALGAALARRLQAGDVVFLQGDLGAGKTTLARGLIEAWTGETDAPSPTYTLVQTYDGAAGPLWHMDLYRLKQPDDVMELGLEEALGVALLLIEWPDRLGPYAPPDRIEIALSAHAKGRIAAITGMGRHTGFMLDG